MANRGHVGYTQSADNAIHKALPVLTEMAHREWCRGNEYFPPSVFHVVSLQAGVGADNVVPGLLEVVCNLRYSTELTEEGAQRQIVELLEQAGLDFDVTWTAVGRPFLTAKGRLVTAAEEAIAEVTGLTEIDRSTAGGTSDGRFIAPTGAEVIELGPNNETIHKVDERVSIEELESLVELYVEVIKRLLASPNDTHEA